MLGVPCNQFGAQEPGSAEEIATFCSTNYGVTFPLTEKVEVNGDGRHPLYQQLVDVPDSDDGHTGDIRWNFEKFLVAPGGEVVARFNPMVEPTSDEVVGGGREGAPGLSRGASAQRPRTRCAARGPRRAGGGCPRARR